jgi:DNA-binding SARP family transcriptional activator
LEQVPPWSTVQKRFFAEGSKAVNLTSRWGSGIEPFRPDQRNLVSQLTLAASEVTRMKSAQFNPPLHNALIGKTFHNTARKHLEITISTIHTLSDALVALATGNLERTQYLLNHGLNGLGEMAENFSQFEFDHPEHLSQSVGMARDADKTGYKALMSSQQLEHGPVNHHVLELKTLGKLEVHVNDIPVRFAFAKCGELLVWIVLHGPATRDQICDALWDGEVTSSNLEYFRVVVRRTRAALTEAGLSFNPLVFEDKLYRISDQLEVRIDALELTAAVNSPTPARLQKAVAAYHGEFMPQTTHEWARLERTIILDLAIEAAIQLAELLEPDDARLAITMYRRAIEIEPFSDTARAKLICLHERLGETAAAEAVRRAYQRVLELEG